MTLKNDPDHLTGLYTRKILEQLNLQFSTALDGNIWSLMIIDIDHFKQINETYGYLHGNRILRQITNVLARNRRKADTLLRYGGDEFVIVMPDTEQLKAVRQAQKILKTLGRETFLRGISVGLSIGVAESRHGDRNLSRVFDRADRALYEAKRGGRGRVSFHRNTNHENAGGETSFEHFVGRQSELSTLRDILGKTITGKGQFVLVTGEPGIGKSRLVKELEHYYKFRECLFLESRCDEHGADRPYEQLTRPIARQLAAFSKTSLRNLAMTVGEILPQTAKLFPGLKLKPARTASTDGEGVVRFRIFSEISSILRWISTRSSVVFVVDNLQWISDNEFDLLAYLARANTDVPILFLTTMRDPVEGNPNIWTKLRILSNLIKFKSINLGRLDDEYSRQMVMSALCDPDIPGNLLEKLVKLSSGNPLYLRELLISLRNSEVIKPDPQGTWIYRMTGDLPLPKTISQLMSSLIEGLDGFSRETLYAGSLMAGGTFSLDPLCAVLQRSRPDVVRALEKPQLIGLISEKSSKSNILEYHFTHDTMRSFLYHELTADNRREMQSRFGLYYEGIYNLGNTAVIPLAAHHYCDSLNRTKAMQFALLAEKEASKRDAKQEALRWLEKYMSLGGTSKEESGDAFHVRLELGKLYILHAKNKKAADILKEAAKFATEGVQTGLLSYQEALLNYNKGKYSDAITLYRNAIELLPPEKEKFRILASLQMAFIRFISEPDAGVLIELEKVLEDIKAVKDRNERKQLMAEYHMRHSVMAFNSATRIEQTGECLKAVTIYRQLNDKIGEVRALLNTAAILYYTSKYEIRIGILTDALRILIQTGDTHAIMCAYVSLGQVYYSAMEFDLSRDYFQRCLELVEATGTKRFGIYANNSLALMDASDGDYSSAQTRLNSAIETSSELGFVLLGINIKLNLVEMLINKEDFQQVDVILTELETEESKKIMDSKTLGSLQGKRGTERLKNPYIKRSRALEQAESLLLSATKNIQVDASIEDIDLLGTLAQCLQARGKLDKASNTVSRAMTLLQNYLSENKSDYYKQKILSSPTAAKLNKLAQLLEESTSISKEC